MGKNAHGIMQLKAEVVKFAEHVKKAEKQEIVEILQE